MKRTPLKAGTKLLRRSKPLPARSAKRKAYRASDEGKEALAYMLAVKGLPCCICQAPAPSEAHHVIHDRFGTRKSSDFDVIALCVAHHRIGPDAIHENKRAWREKYGPDYGYIEQTRKMAGYR